MGKVNWVFGNLQFIQQFTSANLYYLLRKSTDHKLMVIRCVSILRNYGPIPFRYQNMWNSHDSFIPLIK